MFNITIVDKMDGEYKRFKKEIEALEISLKIKIDILYLSSISLLEVREYKENELIFIKEELINSENKKKIRKIGEQGNLKSVVIIANSEKNILKAFEMRIYRYLLEPVDNIKIIEVIIAYLIEISNKKRKILIKERNIYNIVDLLRVNICEFSDGFTRIIGLEETYTIRLSIDKLERIINDLYFVRCNKNTLINMRNAYFYINDDVIINGSAIKIDKKYRDIFDKRLKLLHS